MLNFMLMVYVFLQIIIHTFYQIIIISYKIIRAGLLLLQVNEIGCSFESFSNVGRAPTHVSL